MSTPTRNITVSTADAGGHDLERGTNGPPAPTDIEALARSYDDVDWADFFAELECDEPLSQRDDALLAYLDSVWTGLRPSVRSALVTPVAGMYDAEDELCEAGLLRCTGYGCSHELCPLDLTPLGRAVLRRAEE